MPQTGQIDLSAGFVPKGEQGTDIDLSAGFVAKPRATPEQPSAANRYFTSALHGLGLPANPQEFHQQAEAEANKSLGQRLMEGPGGSWWSLVTGPASPVGRNLPAVGRTALKAGSEVVESARAGAKGDVTGAAGHAIGALGYGGATLTAPILGESLPQAGEQIGSGDVAGGLGTATPVVAPFVAGALLPRGSVPRGTSKAATTPEHIEALTGFIKTTKTDPHITASTALPEARAVAAREGVDPSTFQGRRGGEQVTGRGGVFHKAIQEHRAEYAALRRPVEETQLDTTPIAEAYLSKITPEMQANAPQIANRLTTEAEKFADVKDGKVIGVKPQSVSQLDDFRVRLNNELDKYEQSAPDKQLRSDVEVKADKAAVDAARDLVYKTIARNSPDPVAAEAHIRDIQQRQGALIEARRDLTQAFNDASGSQGESVAGSLRANPPGSGRFVSTLGEKASHLYPSKRGLERAAAREIGPKPLTIFNNRLKLMFENLEKGGGQAAQPSTPSITLGPGAPGLSGTTRSISLNGQPLGHVTYDISGDTLTIHDLGGAQQNYNVMANKLGREGLASLTQQLKQAHPEVKYIQGIRVGGARGEAGRSVRIPVNRLPKSAVQPPYRAESNLSPQQKATAWMLAAKRGDVTQEEASRRAQRLVGSGGSKIRRPVGGND